MPYPNGYNYRLPITVANGSATQAISYGQVAVSITGSQYTQLVTGCTNYPVDIAVTASDGVTTIPFWTEDTTIASTLSLLVKVPAVPANGSTTIYVYYGKTGATSASSPTAVINPQVAITANVDIINQSTPGLVNTYNFDPLTVVLKNQGGVNGGGAGLNGRILVLTGNCVSNGSAPSLIWLNTSTNSGVSWTNTSLLTTPPGGWTGGIGQAFGELPDGTLFFTYGSHATSGGVPNSYIAKSVNGGSTWTNLSWTAPANPISVPWVVGTDNGFTWSGFVFDGSNNIYMTSYWTHSGDTGWHIGILKCPVGSDPSIGSNWSTQGTIFNNTQKWNEPTIAWTGGNNMICVMREEIGGDLWLSTSSNLGVTWSAPTAMNIPGHLTPANNAVAPQLLVLASGNVLLTYGVRYPIVSGAGSWGSGALLSTDGGFTWLNYPMAVINYTLNTGQTNTSFGYPFPAQMANGNIICTYYYETGSNANTTNVGSVVFTEDWLVNQAWKYSPCTATTGSEWISVGPNITADATHVHDQAKSFKFDNTAGNGVVAIRQTWSADQNQGASNVGYSHWKYITMITNPQDIDIWYNDNVGSTGAKRIEWVIVPTPYHYKINSGGSFVDTGVAATLNAWQKSTMYASIGASSITGSLYLNNTTLITNALAQVASGGLMGDRETIQCGTATTSSNTQMWLADVYTHQYYAAVPVITLGSQQTPSATVVTSTIPASSATGVTSSTEVDAFLSAPALASSVTTSAYTLKLAGSTVAGTVYASSNKIGYVPSVLLTVGSVYTAEVTSSVLDISSNPVTDYVWTFTTATGAYVVSGPGGVQPSTTTAGFLITPNGVIPTDTISFSLSGPGSTGCSITPSTVTFTSTSTPQPFSFVSGSALGQVTITMMSAQGYTINTMTVYVSTGGGGTPAYFHQIRAEQARRAAVRARRRTVGRG